MTYRSIFVHVDDAEPCDRRIDYAARLARKYPAELLGGYILPPTELTRYARAVMAPDTVERYLQERRESRAAAEARFRAAAAEVGITNLSWRWPSRNPVGAAVLYARYADLAVIGQPPRDEPTVEFSNDLANAVVTSSGRPVLFVPYVGEYKTLGERVLIAWKDSRESARAVADALPLLKDAKKVFAVAITPAGEDSDQEMTADAEVAAFLRRHQVEATVTRIVAEDIAAGELLLSQVADFGADLIVMGAYSRPRLNELVWGGVTRVMLSSMTAPVLMSH
jgi:nucleotide-binding universal stress UspA family protein